MNKYSKDPAHPSSKKNKNTNFSVLLSHTSIVTAYLNIRINNSNLWLLNQNLILINKV